MFAIYAIHVKVPFHVEELRRACDQKRNSGQTVKGGDDIMKFLIAFGAVLFAAAYMFGATQIRPLTIAESVGPRVFPMLIGIGILVSAMLIALEGFRERRLTSGSRSQSKPAATRGEDPSFAWKRPLTVTGVIAWTLLYVVLLDFVGYPLLTPLFMFGIASVFNPGKWTVNFLVAIGFGVAVYLVFTAFLGVQLPRGLLAFS